MLSFFHRKKKVTVDFFTCDVPTYELVPINKASSNYPEWWKQLPENYKVKNFQDAILRQAMDPFRNNMKRCWGFTELFKRGVMIRHWCDLYVEVDPTTEMFNFVYSNGEAPESHPPEQHNFSFSNYYHMKFKSPWRAKEKHGIPFMMIGAFWNNENLDLSFCPGIQQYNVSHSTNINLFFPKKKERYEFSVKLGQPVAHLISLRDDLDIDYKCHLVDVNTIKSMDNLVSSSFFGSYGINKFIKTQPKSNCPFHF
jgi:hypothetical protein